MFKNLRNNYYFGKAGKADFTVDDLPATRLQLFRETLRTRLGTLTRVNILYALSFIPLLVVLVIFLGNIWNVVINSDLGDGTSLYGLTLQQEQTEEAAKTLADYKPVDATLARDAIHYYLFRMLLWIIPCIALTGPFTAGVSYLVRNWSRDEHAFAWTDFKDALKDNWKQALPVSLITGMVPFFVYLGVTTYHDMAVNNMLFIIPEAIVIIAGIMWSLAVTYMYPLMVTYELKFKDLMRNAFLLAVARLPWSVGIRLLHCVPVVLAVGVVFLFPSVAHFAILFLIVWYALLGLMLSRFVTASYCNAVFDRFINPRIQGAKVNQGLRKEDDDDEEEESAEEKKEEPRELEKVISETEKRVEE